MLRALVVLCVLAVSATAEAAHDCIFDVTGRTLRLAGDCRTDASIVIPDGMTLDGANHTITAVDPPGGHFTGAIVVNAGRTASVIDTRLTTEGLADVCDFGDGRLRGILLIAASGVLRGNVVTGIDQGSSECQEGNGVEVWNFSGPPVLVEIVDNVVEGYQKSGIVVSGSVDAEVRFNRIGPSAARASVPPNAVQVSFGAWAVIERNDITGTRWPLADAAATAILLSNSAPGTIVRRNTVTGNADVGIYIAAKEATVTQNVVIDDGEDGFYDIGIVNAGENNRVRDNDVRGYEQRYLGEEPAEASGAGLQVE